MYREDVWGMTGREGYEYDVLCDLDEGQLRAYCGSVRQQFAKLAKEWSDDKNTAWVARHYLAVKCILAAQLKASAAAYATGNNLLIVVPYLHYYSLFHCCRAFLLTRPNESFDISEATHSKVINSTVTAIGTLSGTLKSDLQGLLNRSQSLRELFSYRFPATGLAITNERPSSEEVFVWARRLAELAELNSECLASALAKHCTAEFQIDWHQLADLCGYETPKHELDSDDYYRLGYLSRKKPAFELMYIARPGMIEDFFGAWIADEDFGLPEHAFDPEHGDGLRWTPLARPKIDDSSLLSR